MTKPADVTAALELARFDLEQPETHMGSAYMSPQPGYGDWVKYEDAAALATALADATRLKEAAEARVAELTAKLEAAPVQVGVKPLEWRRQSVDCEVAETVLGNAAVQNESHALKPNRWGWWMVGSGEDDSPTGYEDDLEAAKAAAQADYEARIRSALIATPAPSPDVGAQIADAVKAERAWWVKAIEAYFDATAVMDIETHVANARALAAQEGGE